MENPKNGTDEVLLVIDEVQKVQNWSEIVKKLWDEDTRAKTNIKVILSGSSRLLIKKGLTESLQGRFELIQIPHWTFPEMKEAFGFSLDEYVFFGGYPGSAELIKDEKRWKSCLRDSIIETSISKDILRLTTITKPALLHKLFDRTAKIFRKRPAFTRVKSKAASLQQCAFLGHERKII